MNALADMPPPRKSERPRPTARGAYLVATLAALAVHAGVIFGWKGSPGVAVPPEFAVELAETSLEAELVAALPAEETMEVVEPPPEPEPIEPPPEPVIEPPPIAEQPPEMTLPEPEPPPPPKPVQPPKPRPEKAPAKPKPARPVGDGSSAIPGNDATSAKRSAGGAVTKPGYLRNPHPTYPEEARQAGQQGVVTLRVSVDAEGQPTSVGIMQSSGFAVLDERARSTVAGRWRFKPARAASGEAVSSQVTIPIRFHLPR